MSETPPTVYLLDGDDEFAQAELIAGLASKLGDPTSAEMNTTRLDGASTSIEQIELAAFAMPFLAPRRLVIVSRPAARLNTKPLRERFLKLLGNLPPTTALVLVEPGPLTKERDRREGKTHWLEQWAVDAAPLRLLPPLPAAHRRGHGALDPGAGQSAGRRLHPPGCRRDGRPGRRRPAPG